MVILVNNSPISDSPRSLNWLTSQYPSLKAGGAKQLVTAEPKQLTGSGVLYVGMREYAVTHATDSSISVVGTDNLINNTAVIVRNSGAFSFWRHFFLQFRLQSFLRIYRLGLIF